MQPHKIDHESIRIHPPWTPLIHHCWSSSLISNLSFNQNHDPNPPTKNPSLNLLNMRNSSTNSPIEIALASEGRFSASGKKLPWECGVFFFLFFLVGKTTSNKPSNSFFFFWKKCPTRPTIRVPAFLGLFFFFWQLKEKQQKTTPGIFNFFSRADHLSRNFVIGEF